MSILEQVETRIATIKQLAADGEICAIFGHNWRAGRLGEGDGIQFLDYHPNTEYRTCKICKKTQSQTLNNWE